MVLPQALKREQELYERLHKSVNNSLCLRTAFYVEQARAQ